MRSIVFKSLAMAVLAVVMLSAPLMPGASAQGPPGEGPDDRYVPAPVPVFDCSDVPFPTLGLDGFVVVSTYDEIYLQCVVRVVIEFNPVLYDGPPSATLSHREPLPPLAPGEHTITVTATTVFGVDKAVSLKLSAEEVAAINALIAAAGGGTYQEPSVPAGDGIPVPGSGFAVTGSNVNLPVAIGATLIGAGGVALMIARRREQGIFA